MNEKKIPLVPEGHPFMERPMSSAEVKRYFKKAWGIAIITGGPWDVEVLDFDLKYDIVGKVMERYEAIVPKEILEKIYRQTTMNNGIHLIYRTKDIEPNQKLALRYTTEDEKYEVYAENYMKNKRHSDGFKAAVNHKNLVLIETRGGTALKGGGYALIYPTPTYSKVSGKIEYITNEEREILVSAARELNEVNEFKIDYNIIRTVKQYGDNPFEKYNELYSGVDILTSRGWSIVSDERNTVRLLRPGVVHSKSSAIWHKDKKFLKVFSSSTSLDIHRVYSAVDLFVEMECANDTKLAYKKLKEMGL